MARGSIIPALGPDAQRQIAEDYRKRPVRSETDKAWRAAYPPETQPRKYRNTPTIYKSIQGFELTAASKAEARGYAELDRLMQAKRVVRWVTQVGFLLQGGSRYVCDALIFWPDGNVTVRDYKGVETPAFKIKRGLMRSTYNLEIELA